MFHRIHSTTISRTPLTSHAHCPTTSVPASSSSDSIATGPSLGIQTAADEMGNLSESDGDYIKLTIRSLLLEAGDCPGVLLYFPYPFLTMYDVTDSVVSFLSESKHKH